MKSFFKRKGKKKPGWMAIGFRADGVAAAYARRAESGSKPIVEWLSFYPTEKQGRPGGLARLDKERHVATHQSSFLLPHEDYQLLQMEAPVVPPDELKSAVRWRLRDMLDFHIDDATFDVLSVPADKGAGGRPGSMFAVVAKNLLIGQTQAMFDDADLDLRVIDIPEMAQRNLAALVETEGRAVAMLSIDDEGALLTITAGGELYASRRMDVTASQIHHLHAESFYERIALEMQRSLDHFERQHHTLPLSRVVLGPMRDASGLQAYLSANLYVPVEALDLGAVLDMSRVPELQNKDAQQKYFMVIGAALRHEETVL